MKKTYFISSLIIAICIGFFILNGETSEKNNTKENIKIKYNPNTTKFLEDAKGKKALEWSQQRTKQTKEFLKASKFYKPIRKNLEKLLYDPRKTLSGFIREGYVYNFWRDEKNPQGIWRRTLLSNYSKDYPKWEILINFDALSKIMGQKLVARCFLPCPQQPNLFLVHMSFGGKDETFFKEWDLEKKQFVSNGFITKSSSGNLLEGKFTQGVWIDSNSILFNPDFKRNELTKSLYPNALYLWKRGQRIENVTKIYEIPKHYLNVAASTLLNYSGAPSLMYIYGLRDFYNIDSFIWDKNNGLRKIHMPSDAFIQGSFKEYVFFTLRSDWNIGKVIPKGSVVALHWSDLLKEDHHKSTLKIIFTPTDREVFLFLSYTQDTIFLATLKNVCSKVYIFGIKDNQWTTPTPLSLPYEKACISISSEEKTAKALIEIETKIVPPSIFLWENSTLNLIRKPLYPFNSKDYVLKQRQACSKDGVMIPYFIVYKKGIKFDGSNPTLLTAYGGFQNTSFPYFDRIENEIWVSKGGVSVVANIRGGGEFGPNWHIAAIQEKRQTAFNDFIAVAKDLIKQKITTPQYLGIIGGSNGGLLVSVAMTQRPDLFKAVVCEVPILDMVRYTKFGAGDSWIAEYGDPADPKMLEVLKRYSPLENLFSTQLYPSVLITSSVLDQRVHPWHARIFQYMLEQHPTAKPYFIESKDAGHGCGADLTDTIEYFSNLYTFFAIKLRLDS